MVMVITILKRVTQINVMFYFSTYIGACDSASSILTWHFLLVTTSMQARIYIYVCGNISMYSIDHHF